MRADGRAGASARPPGSADVTGGRREPRSQGRRSGRRRTSRRHLRSRRPGGAGRGAGRPRSHGLRHLCRRQLRRLRRRRPRQRDHAARHAPRNSSRARRPTIPSSRTSCCSRPSRNSRDVSPACRSSLVAWRCSPICTERRRRAASLNRCNSWDARCRLACSTTTAVGAYLARLFSARGRTNDFRQLANKLFIVATDLDSCAATPFGAPGCDDVPISRAVQASSALPGLYPPVEIDGRHYVDGALMKTLHASVALAKARSCSFCVNPLTPFDADAVARKSHRQPRVARRRAASPPCCRRRFAR